LDAGFIHEVHYPCWLANLVMVKKKNDKWRMCTNFTDLNKCCPKDDFPLSRIDMVVDSAAGSEIMALLDFFWGITKSGSVRRTKRRQVLTHLLELIVISGCLKASRMLVQHFAG
jgi:hypothetical protein